MRHMTPWPKHAGRAGLGRARRDAPCLPQPRTRRWHGTGGTACRPSRAICARERREGRHLASLPPLAGHQYGGSTPWASNPRIDVVPLPRRHGVATAGRLPGRTNRLRRNYFRRNLLVIAARSRLDITYDLAIRAEETSDMPLTDEFRAHGRARPSLASAFRAGLCILAASIAAWPAIARAASAAADSGSTSITAAANQGTPKMDAATASNIFREFVQKRAAGGKIDPAMVKQYVAATNNDPKTGPKVGEKVPDFTLTDQNGKQWSLHELMGPTGLLLVFFRSADW